MDNYLPRSGTPVFISPIFLHRVLQATNVAMIYDPFMRKDIKPIHSEADYDTALGEIERLWGARSGTPDGDRLDVLATLIDAYEAERYPMDPPDPIEAIKFRMEQQGMTRKDLEPLIGTRTRVAEVLNRKRNLSIAMIRRLHSKLGIPAEVLIKPSRKKRRRLPVAKLKPNAKPTRSLAVRVYSAGRR
jgi:HTH-type transcriptional regulator / antitoxin HigA